MYILRCTLNRNKRIHRVQNVCYAGRASKSIMQNASQKWLNCTCWMRQREVLLMTLHKFNNKPHCTYLCIVFVSVFVYLRMSRSIIRECLRRDFSRKKTHRCIICRKRQIGICYVERMKETIVKKLSACEGNSMRNSQNGRLKCIKGRCTPRWRAKNSYGNG